MLPPATIPARGTIVESDNPASSASSSTSVATQQPIFNSSRLVWSDRAHISSGAFAGKYMRFNLEVAQQPIHGRRKTEKDRRPLAHCPIVRLRFKECKRITDGTMRGHPDWEEGWEEEEIDVSLVEASNFICAAELFSPDETPKGSPLGSARPSLHHGEPSDGVSGGRSPSSASRTPRGSPDRPRRPPPAPLSIYPSRSIDGDITMGRTKAFVRKDADAGPMPSMADLAHGNRHSESSPNVLRHVRDAPAQLPEGLGDLHEISETLESRQERQSVAFGRNLYGNSHVSGVRVPAPEGGVGLWFLFTDVTVKHEGTYTLRFRCFDITAIPVESATPSPPLVSAYSHAFTVYSPRNFPGIPKPTELAEHFNRLGFKLNTRKVSEPSASTTRAAAAHASTLRQNERAQQDRASTPESSDTNRRPSPKPVQHSERGPSSLGRYSTSAAQNNTSSSTDMGSGSWSSATDTGTITAPSSAAGSGQFSAGAGGLVIPVGSVGSAGSVPLGASVGPGPGVSTPSTDSGATETPSRTERNAP